MSRIRTNPQTFRFHNSAQDRNNGGTYTNFSYTPSENKTDSMTDEVTPGYFATRRKQGYLPMNPMNQTKYLFEASSGSGDWRQWLDPNVYPGYAIPYQHTVWSGNLAVNSYWQSSGQTTVFPSYQSTTVAWPAEGPLLVNALANARKRGFDAGTFLAELGKTIGMVASFRDNVLRRASRISEDLIRKKRYASQSEVLAGFSQTWLEGRYGWRTLAYDLEDINVALIKLGVLKKEYIRSRDSATAETSHTWHNTTIGALTRVEPSISNGSFISRGSFVSEQTLTRDVRVGVMLDAVADGLAFVDPLVTAWEVVPFSFIVDWFVNIGDNVAAFSPTASGSLKHSYMVRTETTALHGVFTPAPPSTSGVYLVSYDGPPAFTFSSEKVVVARTVQNPTVSLDFDVNLDTSKLVDLASIFFLRWAGVAKSLTQAVSSFRRSG